jgi:hypothetical protein
MYCHPYMLLLYVLLPNIYIMLLCADTLGFVVRCDVFVLVIQQKYRTEIRRKQIDPSTKITLRGNKGKSCTRSMFKTTQISRKPKHKQISNLTRCPWPLCKMYSLHLNRQWAYFKDFVWILKQCSNFAFRNSFIVRKITNCKSFMLREFPTPNINSVVLRKSYEFNA